MLCIVLALIAAPTYGLAQDSGRIEVSGGYLLMRSHDDEMTFPRGWFGALAVDVVGPLAVVGEVSGSYKSISEFDALSGVGTDFSARNHAFMGGPRLTWRAGRVWPHAQMLFGLSRIASSVEWTNGVSSDGARNNFAMTPGGGVDVWFSNRAAARVGGSVRLIRGDRFGPGSERYTFKEFQFITGIVFR